MWTFVMLTTGTIGVMVALVAMTKESEEEKRKYEEKVKNNEIISALKFEWLVENILRGVQRVNTRVSRLNNNELEREWIKEMNEKISEMQIMLDKYISTNQVAKKEIEDIIIEGLDYIEKKLIEKEPDKKEVEKFKEKLEKLKNEEK